MHIRGLSQVLSAKWGKEQLQDFLTVLCVSARNRHKPKQAVELCFLLEDYMRFKAKRA